MGHLRISIEKGLIVEHVASDYKANGKMCQMILSDGVLVSG